MIDTVKVYEIEIVTGKGNRWVKSVYSRITDARKRAVKEIKGIPFAFANIHSFTDAVPGGLRKTVERVDLDDYMYDFTVTQYLKHRRYRVSPKTGKLLDFDRNWKYI